MEQPSLDNDALVAQIAQLLSADLETAQFYAELIEHLARTPSAVNLAVWQRIEGSPPVLLCQTGLDQSILLRNPEARQQHQQLVIGALAEQRARNVPVNTAPTEGQAADAQCYHLLLSPVVVEGVTEYLIEMIQQATDLQKAPERALALLSTLALLAETFHRMGNLRQRAGLIRWSEQLQQFSETVHQSLHPTEVAYCLANDGRRLLECDRLTVLLKRGNNYRIAAVSGQETIQRRANTARDLERLARRVFAAGSTLRYPDPVVDIPPPIEEALQQCMDRSQAKSMLVFPLLSPRMSPAGDEVELRESEASRRGDRLGGLVVEQFSGTLPQPRTWRRLEAVARQGSLALGNALEHHRVFLLPLWAMLGRTTANLTGGRLARLLICGLGLLAVVLALCLVPTEFYLLAEGTVQPKQQRNIYTRTDGVVSELLVDEGAHVARETVLVKLRNTPLDLQIEEVVGELQTTSKKLAALSASRLAGAASSQRDHSSDNQLAAEEEETRQWLKSLQSQHQLLMQQKDNLTIRSPIAGDVVTWNPRKTLAARPVVRGQLLLTVADLDGLWVLELMVPDRGMGHLLRAQQETEQPLPVSFVLATSPGERLPGQLLEVAKSSQLGDQQGPSVLVTVSFDKEKIGYLRPGAAVTAKIDCGQRSLGYVWFRELWEFLQTRVFFRW